MHRYVKVGLLLGILVLSGCSVSEQKKSDLEFTANSMEGDAKSVDLCVVEPYKTPEEPKPALVGPYSVDLYFITNTEIFNAESAREAEKIYQTVLERQSDKIILIGYTDTVGSYESNKALSMRRVERVKRDLIARGIAESKISVAWHGEDHLSVDTADNVDEQQNRRVEIYVR
jgi:outer membrane protein OmpA-like peptidoglycan-associated protein